jgi:hypothetical protein
MQLRSHGESPCSHAGRTGALRLRIGCIPAPIVALCRLGFQAVRKPVNCPYPREPRTGFAVTRPGFRARSATEPNSLAGFENVQFVTSLFRQDHKNVPAGRSARPIQSMSVGKPIQSGTTEKRLRNIGRVQGRTGGSGAKGQGWPFTFQARFDLGGGKFHPRVLARRRPEILGPSG